MAIIQASFSIARSGSSVVIKVVGRANNNSSENFSRLMDEEMGKGCRNFVLDLSECLIMDSTFLGMLVHKVETSKTESNPEPIRVELFDPIACILDLMEDLGALSLFKVLDTSKEPATSFTAVTTDTQRDKLVLLRNSIAAHETLLQLITKPEKKASIEMLVSMMKEELASLESGK